MSNRDCNIIVWYNNFNLKESQLNYYDRCDLQVTVHRTFFRLIGVFHVIRQTNYYYCALCFVNLPLTAIFSRNARTEN